MIECGVTAAKRELDDLKHELAARRGLAASIARSA